jgi:hypothetical protein
LNKKIHIQKTHQKYFWYKNCTSKKYTIFVQMKSLFRTFIFLLLISSFTAVCAQENVGENDYIPPGGARLRVLIEGNDTIFLARTLPEVTVFPPMVFRNRREEQFYWRTVRDVKRTLPYAKLVASEVIATNQHLLTLPNDRARREYMDAFEKELFKKYEADLKKMTFSQGKMLIKLIERECDKTSYELIRLYRGRVTAGFWQGIARIFGANLKTTFNTSTEEDRIIERVIMMVEAGML